MAASNQMYECRFDFSTHLYVLAAPCLLPSAESDYCLSPPVPHFVCVPVGLMVDRCVGPLYIPSVSHSVVDFVARCLVSAMNCICPCLSPDLTLFRKFDCGLARERGNSQTGWPRLL